MEIRGVERMMHGMHGSHHGQQKTFSDAAQWNAPRAQTEERKAAIKFSQMIDGRSFSAQRFAHFFQYQSIESQVMFYRIMMHMIDHWANLYFNGEVGPHSLPIVQEICEQAARFKDAE